MSKEWSVSTDGRTIYSDDFEHDVTLDVSGDFEDDDQLKAYSDKLAEKLNINAEKLAPLSDDELKQIVLDAGIADGHPEASFDDLSPEDIRNMLLVLRAVEQAHGIRRPE